MSSSSEVFVAGVGYTPLPPGGSPRTDVHHLVSAATKALLDAGLTYDYVSRGVRSKNNKRASDAFETFDERGITVDEVKDGTELDSSCALISDKDVQCVLMIAVDESCATAFVLVSTSFLWRHSYLKDSSALIRKGSSSRSDSGGKTKRDLHDICQIVWALRGWSGAKVSAAGKNDLTYQTASGESFSLSRADSSAVPKWSEVEHKQDGKHRLGYNPAAETRDISGEDFEAVRAAGMKPNATNNKFTRRGGDRAALTKL